MDLGPAEVHDLTLAAPGEQQKANDVRLLPPAFPGLPVEDTVQTADLLARQEAREPGSAVGPDALRGVLLDVAASDREVHDLPEKVERMVGIAGSGAAEGIEPAPEPSRVDTVEPLRSEGGKNAACEQGPDARFCRRFVSFEMSLLPLALDELPQQRDRVRRRGLLVRLVGGLSREAFPAGLGDAHR